MLKKLQGYIHRDKVRKSVQDPSMRYKKGPSMRPSCKIGIRKLGSKKQLTYRYPCSLQYFDNIPFSFQDTPKSPSLLSVENFSAML